MDDRPAVFARTGLVPIYATRHPIQIGGYGLATVTSPAYVPADEVAALCSEGLLRWEHTATEETAESEDDKPRKRGKEK